MSNSPMCGVAGYPAEAWTMDCAEIQRKRDALHSRLAVLEEARRRLEEIEHDDAGGQLGFLSSDTADDDFYPLDVDDDDETGEERPMQWQDQVCRQMLYNNSRHLQQNYSHHADSNNLDDDDVVQDEMSRDIVALGLHIPNIASGTVSPPPFASGEADAAHVGSFGAVPASAAAIASLSEHRYDGSGNDSMCVICMRDYRKGRKLRVIPCTYKHRFHGRCIRKWLSRSNMCPLCRHALPKADAEQGGVHNRSTIVRVRVNVSPY